MKIYAYGRIDSGSLTDREIEAVEEILMKPEDKKIYFYKGEEILNTK